MLQISPCLKHRPHTYFSVFVLCLVLIACSAKQPASQMIPCADPVSGCAFVYQEHPVRLTFDQTPIPLKPFHLEIRSEAPLSKLHIGLAMDGMEMGLNQYQLIKVDPNHWAAEIILPVCIRGRADWRMELALTGEFGEKVYRTTFLSKSQ